MVFWPEIIYLLMLGFIAPFLHSINIYDISFNNLFESMKHYSKLNLFLSFNQQ